MTEYYDRRKRALAAFDGVAIIPAAHAALRNNDTEYEFRQNSDFYYLTGFDEPDAVLVLARNHPEHQAVLFLRERDRAMEIWNGRRLGVERAVDVLGVDAAFPIDELHERLPDYLLRAATLYVDLGADHATDRLVRAALDETRQLARRRGAVPDTITSVSSTLHAMRAIKSPAEVVTMRRSATIASRAHLAAMRATRPGLREYEIEAVIEYEFLRGGAQRPAYETIVASGDNATILHYRENRDHLADGELLLVDAGCEYDYYASDLTRTWPINGRFTAEQRAIYEIVLTAHGAASAAVKPGAPQRAFHRAAVRVITEGLIDLGLLDGSLDENLEREAYRDYYMHGTGHWLGMDVHDVGRYRDAGGEPVHLQPGMVTTVEPGIYVQRDATCNERFRGIGVRLEDDFVVTESGNENLTGAVPIAIDEIEAIVGSGSAVVSS